MAGGSAGGMAGGSAGGSAGGMAGGLAGGMAGGAAGGGIQPGETCATALAPITTNSTLTAQALGTFVDDYQWFSQPGCAPSGTVAQDRVYQVTVPANQRVRITVTPNANWNPSIQLTDICVAGPNPMMQTCIAGSDSAFDGAPETLDFVNASVSPRTMFLVVDTNSNPMDVTTFDMTIQFLTPQLGDVCSTAFALDGGAQLAQNLDLFVNDYGNGIGCAAATGLDRVYSATIPPGNRLTATATAATLADGGVAFAPTLNVISAATCTAASACVAGANAAPGTGAAAVAYDNVGTTPQNVFLVVDTASASVQGTFDLTATIAPSVLLPGDVCGNTAAPIATSTMLTAQPLAGYVDHYSVGNSGPSCDFENGPDRVYAVTVPAGFRLRLLSNASFPHSVGVVDGPATNCLASSVACVASQSGFAPGALTTVYDNPGATRTVFVVVDRPAMTPAMDTFDLGIDLQMVAPNETCATAGTPITTATTLTMQNLAGAANDYTWTANRCAAPGAGSPDLVYAVTVPSGNRLTATVTGIFNPVINVVDGTVCASGSTQTCLASANLQTGGTEVVTFDNTNAGPRTVFVVVENANSTGPATFDIAFAFSVAPPPPYVKTLVPAACSALTGAATAVPGTIGDDVESTWAALPFTFNFFGAPVTTFSVSSNGYVGFSNLTTGTIARDFSNEGIPNNAVPNGIAAPFWDDLLNQTMPTPTSVRTETFGTMGSRRFVVEWAQLGVFSGNGERLTFQVHVLEGTNVVEFHYCTLDAGAGSATRVTGDSATVGLESSTGSEGLEHSFNAASSVSTTQAIRFTP